MLTSLLLAASIALAPAEIERRIDELLAQMTLREKAGQLTQHVLHEDNCASWSETIVKGEVGSFINHCRQSKWASREGYDRCQRLAVEKSRLKIPLLFGYDVIHGCYTAFPIPLALACAFEPALFERAQHIAAVESRWAGYDWVFAPMCDTARDPRWGRVAESCGEDPYLNALCCAAQVRGLQGDDCAADDRVVACMKHFVGYSDSIGGRDYNLTEFSDWSLRNLHLPPFRAAVEAGVATVMSSFNTIDGIPACQSKRTLRDILRGEWGFSGLVVSDWNAVGETVKWQFAADAAAATRLALNAGNDMDMVSGSYIENLEAEVAADRVKMATVDEAVRNVLRIKFRAGLFAHPYARALPDAAMMQEFTDRAHDLARECARKSAVLLKNDGTLPLAGRRIALIGPLANDHSQPNGCWLGRAEPCRESLAEALRRELGGLPLTVVEGCSIAVQPVTKTLEDGSVVLDPSAVPADDGFDRERILEAVRASDTVVLALGENAGWTGENQSRAELSLTGRQQELFDLVVAEGKRIVAVIFSGRPLALREVWERSNAVFYVFQPGCEGPAALAELLTGKAAPEGRLAISVPHAVSQVPAYYNAFRTGRPGRGQYRDTPERGARYPFGFGLTYTRFEYGSAVIDGDAIKCRITNVGSRRGVETAQLYVNQLACTAGVRPLAELRGFSKVALDPGESAEVSFDLTPSVFAYTDREGRRCVDEEAEFDLAIAPDSAAAAKRFVRYRTGKN